MSIETAAPLQFPRKLTFLFEHHDYKVAYGGRDGTKSWGYAIALLKIANDKTTRVLCARETQKSIDASVHQLLSDQIYRLHLEEVFEIQQHKIIHRFNGSFFIFAGLHHNPAAIKSAEGVDIVWVEEAQSVSKDSWSKLLPTIRKAGAEVWITMNPELETDETYRRFIIDPPKGAVVVKTGWEDNRWLSDISRNRIEEMREKHPADFEHIYGGECRSAVEGAVYGEEIKTAIAEGRITSVPRDRTRPVDTVWDLGYGDKTAIWFVQAQGGWYNFIDYIEDSGRTIEWYLIQLQQRGYLYGTHWVPHDALDVQMHRNLAGDRTKSIEMIMREAYPQTVRLVAKMLKADTINAGRTLFPTARFDAEKCDEGLRALRMYQWGPLPASGVLKREPLHDAASHGADAYGYAALVIRQPKVDSVPKPAPARRQQEYAPFG